MEASLKTKSSPLLATLAARLAYQENHTENAIVFLQQMIEGAEDEFVKEAFSLRLDALKKVLFLERAVQEFVSRRGRQPDALQDLVENNIISEIPSDPYGGVFFLDSNGQIKATSNFINR
jgi:hypothetical protein